MAVLYHLRRLCGLTMHETCCGRGPLLCPSIMLLLPRCVSLCTPSIHVLLVHVAAMLNFLAVLPRSGIKIVVMLLLRVLLLLLLLVVVIHLLSNHLPSLLHSSIITTLQQWQHHGRRLVVVVVVLVIIHRYRSMLHHCFPHCCIR